MRQGINNLLINIPILYFLIKEMVIVQFWKDLGTEPFEWYLLYRVFIMAFIWYITFHYIIKGVFIIRKEFKKKRGDLI